MTITRMLARAEKAMRANDHEEPWDLIAAMCRVAIAAQLWVDASDHREIFASGTELQCAVVRLREVEGG